ncbi:MAG TPA: hypothetical protein PK079_24320 [Leptospiraceae bacterium]|nr:hypothetical protein [Leptospiraceae bacterium]HMX34462.1 hypothetical protein [Leptospiraceae bacterium]HMY34258.1 hypothetical protein [Leptospiraceae bacterium]HMZ64702.1 hypothetical protein [Leptospiraceae bacterium]HNA08953.1 hypothetical protein [Leptospiraceae bacterium]
MQNEVRIMANYLYFQRFLCFLGKKKLIKDFLAQPSPALRIEAVSINCIALEVYCYAVSRNLLIVAESLTAE